MSIGLWFWVIFVVSLLFYGVFNWPFNKSSGSGLVVFLLLFFLGWAVFGFVIRDDGYPRHNVRVVN